MCIILSSVVVAANDHGEQRDTKYHALILKPISPQVVKMSLVPGRLSKNVRGQSPTLYTSYSRDS